MFSCSDTGNGFHLVFENGWTISVQWHWMNYCGNRDFKDVKPFNECKTAETAALPPYKDTTWVEVNGWQTADEVAKLINEVQHRTRYSHPEDMYPKRQGKAL